MADLCLYLGITLVGYFIGYRCRRYRQKLRWAGTAQTVFLFILVLMMGMKMGANEEITANLSTIGLTALIITIFTLVFTVLGVYLARKLMGFDKYGRMKRDKKSQEDPAAQKHTDDEEKAKGGVNRMTLLIVLAVAGGMLLGYLVIRRAFAENMSAFDSAIALGIKIGLCFLLVFVGMDLGLDPAVMENFKKAGLRILVFPAVAVVSTLLGAALSGLVTGLSLRESLVVGAGFGWYTLAPGIIMEAGYVTTSAISFLHNVMRELIAILLIPLAAQKVGFIEVTCMPGAGSMDVCLPVVEKATRGDIAVYSFVTGVILTALVPVLVPLFLG